MMGKQAPIGSYQVERDQPSLSQDEAHIVDRFHDLYYRRWLRGDADTINLSWYGHQVLKCPLDLWMYQELLVRTQPDVVIETGTKYGGSALYMAMILDHLDRGRVITIDIKPLPSRPEHPRICYVEGSSIDPRVVDEVRQSVDGARAMVVLDSDHSADHVYRELVAYSSFVRVGDYLVVEDTDVNGHPTHPEYGPWPMEALDRFLSESADFVVDARCDRFLLTLNPRGYLKRVSFGKLATGAS